MEWWNRLDPMARRGLIIGVPLVAIAALASALRSPDPTGEGVDGADEAAQGTPGTPPPAGGFVLGGNPDAVNVGELGTMFSDVSSLLSALPQAISDQVNADRPTPDTPKVTPLKGTYTTVGGQNWRAIAKAHYGNAGYVTHLMADARNASIVRIHPDQYAVLPAGLVISLPAYT